MTAPTTRPGPAPAPSRLTAVRETFGSAATTAGSAAAVVGSAAAAKGKQVAARLNQARKDPKAAFSRNRKALTIGGVLLAIAIPVIVGRRRSRR